MKRTNNRHLNHRTPGAAIAACCRGKLHIAPAVYRRAMLVLAVLTASATPLIAQSGSNPPPPLPNQVLPTPMTAGILGHFDPAAAAEIAAHVQEVSAGAWHDLHATGSITFVAGGGRSISLYLMGGGDTRLDIAMDSGTRSLRIRDAENQGTQESGQVFTLPATVASAGVFAFPRLWATAPTSARASFIDHGVYTTGGQSLHRITLEHELGPGATANAPTVASDLYFDPATHLLVYSVDSLVFDNTHGRPLQRVTSYGSYQKYNGVLIPTSFQQSLNGQLQWTLQLSAIELNQNPDPTTFAF